MLGHSEHLLRTKLWASRVNYLSGKTPTGPTRVSAKIRYKASEHPATLTPLGSDAAEVSFDEPQRAVTPGQAVVFYDGDSILGGGYIELQSPVVASAV